MGESGRIVHCRVDLGARRGEDEIFRQLHQALSYLEDLARFLACLESETRLEPCSLWNKELGHELEHYCLDNSRAYFLADKV